VNEGGNLEGDDYLFTSSTVKPEERQLASEMRTGYYSPGRADSNCAGHWLGGVVASGSLIVANRWTTDATGAVTAGGRLAVLHPDGSSLSTRLPASR
jgi:predicted phage tail protein